MDSFLDEFRRTGSTSFTVRVHPAAGHTRVVGVMDDGSVRINVRAPAEDNRANTALVRSIADAFAVPVSCVHIVRGMRNRTKVIRVAQSVSRAS
jgi:uncharacterized protein (TIGR00251 family)